MGTASASAKFSQVDEATYKRRIRAWTLYDWANSAFATTILAAVLPIYFSDVAGATLPSATIATAYWSLGLSVSLLLVAILSPILGTISDVARSKKKFLAVFVGVGITGTALLVLVSTGDWILAAALAILGRIGFSGSITFYDALLPHIAREDDRDRVSAMGFAIGYLGGGILLAINVAMIFLIPDFFDFAGTRLSFLSVAVWWLVFSIPLFVIVPEPPAATVNLAPGETVISASFGRLRDTLRDIGQFKELFKYLISFLIYNDGIGTIIGVAAIYATELGFGAIDTILALLLVQFVGVPFSLIFGRIANKSAKRRAIFFAFIVFNLVLLPVTALIGRQVLPTSISGAPPPPYATTDEAGGEGVYEIAGSPYITRTQEWEQDVVPAENLRPSGLIGALNNPFAGQPEDATYLLSTEQGAALEFVFNGEEVTLEYATGPTYGAMAVEIDGQPVEGEDGQPLVIDMSSEALRYGVTTTIAAEEPGRHTLELTSIDDDPVALTTVEVQPPARAEGFGVIGPLVGGLLAINLVSFGLAALLGRPLFGNLVEKIDTKRGILLALLVYAVIAVWGFFLDSTIEFWFLAWMVAMVQGGSQALSRSLYSAISPASKSGEFFGLFSILEKFASLLGPLMFAAAGFLLGSSRWGVLSLILFFIVGGALLMSVDVEEGKRVAQAEDRKAMGST
jgi:UMF1 family MFS transporter